jgi:tetratricopeptide (TPR) repeat protein
MALYQAGKHAEAYQTALPLAERGDHVAEAMVGNILAMGALGHADVAAARRWWERAALAGYAEAQYNLGLSYVDPDVNGRDGSLARAWLTEAAQGGHQGAMVRLGEWELGSATRFRRARAASGYRWLRVAASSGAADAHLATERATRRSGWGRPDRMKRLRARALRLTLPYGSTAAAGLLGLADRDEAVAYLITGSVLYIMRGQDRVGNTFSQHPSAPNPTSLADVAHQMNDLIPRGLPRDVIAWTLSRKGISYRDVDVVPVSRERLWQLVRPGDVVEVSDDLNSHVASVLSVDRSLGTIRFADPWPEEFLLLPGRNALGAEARIAPYGRTRKMVSVTRGEFMEAARGLAGFAGRASVEALWHGAPELHEEPMAALALAGLLAGSADVGTCALGLGWLMALLRGRGGVRVAPAREAAAADRAWLAAERLRTAAPQPLVSCSELGSSAPGEPLNQLVEELVRCWPPQLETLTPLTLADLSTRRAESGDMEGALALLDRAVAVHADSERLRVARSSLWIQGGRFDAAERELAVAIEALDARRHLPGPLVHGLDRVGSVDVVSRELTELETAALALRAEALMGLQDPKRAVDALQEAIGLAGERGALLERLAMAATAAGDNELASATAERLRGLEYQKLLGRIFGRRPPNGPE